jgi:hypothetical protein
MVCSDDQDSVGKASPQWVGALIRNHIPVQKTELLCDGFLPDGRKLLNTTRNFIALIILDSGLLLMLKSTMNLYPLILY